MSNNKDFVVAGAVEVGKDTKVTLGSITSSDIDLATGNYFADTLTADTTYTLSNAGDVQAFQFEVTGVDVLTNKWDVSTASFVQSLSVSGQEGTPQGIFFKPDGTKMYVVGSGGDKVNEYDLTTAWDVSTASYSQNFSVSAQETTPTGIFFKPDGTKMYITGDVGNDVGEYNLSTAWDVSTSVYNQSLEVSAQEISPSDVFFKPDGTKMYIVGSAGDDVNEYDLSTDWDVSTASFLQNFSVAGQESIPQGVFFKPDGTKMYVTGNSSDNVNEYNLSTAWDISTASFLQNFSVSAQEAAPMGIFFKPDGTKMYTPGAAGVAVYEYDIGSSSAATITWPSSIEWAGGVAPSAPATGETDVYTLVTDDGGTSYVGVKTADNLQ